MTTRFGTGLPTPANEISGLAFDLPFKLLDDAGFDEDARLVGLDRQVEHDVEHLALQVHQQACSTGLLGLQAVTWRSTALRVALDQGARDRSRMATIRPKHGAQPEEPGGGTPGRVAVGPLSW
ncbi:MAG: hypothetical protein H0W47_10375 [Polaromonas sp.]|nr:hypothetical protein [Polaromonas sp.]